MISLVQTLNGLNQIEYSKKVFEFANGSELDINISWLISCAGHTVKRVTNDFKSLNMTELQYRFVCYCFSLLMNSTNLELSPKHFKLNENSNNS